MNKVDEFLQNYHVESTKKSYRVSLNRFFKTIEANPNTYFDENRDFLNDVKILWSKLLLEERPPLSIKQNLMVVKTFLEEYNVVIHQGEWRKMRRKIPGSRAATLDQAPTCKDLKKILTHANAMKRALFLIACSSGMRISTLLKLEPGDIDLELNPPKITIPGGITKSGNPRFCFMSFEAKAALLEFYKVRSQYLETAINRSKNKPHVVKDPDDPTVFPVSYHTARQMWCRLLDKSGYGRRDKTTGRYIMHIHTLRKFFRSNMTYAGVPLDVAEALMGHEGYLTDAYRRYSVEQLGEMYLKGVHAVTVFEGSADISDIKKQLKDKDDELDVLQKEMDVMRRQMNILMTDKLIELDKKGK